MLTPAGLQSEQEQEQASEAAAVFKKEVDEEAAAAAAAMEILRDVLIDTVAMDEAAACKVAGGASSIRDEDRTVAEVVAVSGTGAARVTPMTVATVDLALRRRGTQRIAPFTLPQQKQHGAVIAARVLQAVR